MILHHSKYLLTAVNESQWPLHELSEICLAGRSNVGKSSFINTVLNRHNLARTSSRPGKTQTLNFYLVNDDFCFVDVPGYGYAKINQRIRDSFAGMIETYLESREQLKAMILLVDSRHVPTSDDKMMYHYLSHQNYPILIVATKADKLKKNDYQKQVKMIKNELKMRASDEIILFSSSSRYGLDSVYQFLDKIL